MKFIWGLITFSSFSPEIWLKASFYYRIVGLFRNWRQSSFLLRWGKTIGALLISLILMFSPICYNGSYWYMAYLDCHVLDNINCF